MNGIPNAEDSLEWRLIRKLEKRVTELETELTRLRAAVATLPLSYQDDITDRMAGE